MMFDVIILVALAYFTYSSIQLLATAPLSTWAFEQYALAVLCVVFVALIIFRAIMMYKKYKQQQVLDAEAAEKAKAEAEAAEGEQEDQEGTETPADAAASNSEAAAAPSPEAAKPSPEASPAPQKDAPDEETP